MLLVVPLALAAASCGDTVSLDPVAKAATSSSGQSSEHMSMTANVTVGGQAVIMTADGDFQNKPVLGALTTTVSAAGKSYALRSVQNGTTMYMSSDLFASVLPAGKTWLSLDLQKSAKSLGVSLGSVSSQTPSSVFDQLKGSGGVVKTGTDTIDGVATTHYRGVIDPARAAKLEQALGAKVTYEPVDVWVDAQGLVRRMQLAYSLGASTASPAASTSMTMSFSNYGEHVNVSIPSAADTLDATDAANVLKNGGTS